MDMVKIRPCWYLLRNVDGFMAALADYWNRPLTEDEHRDLIRPQPLSFPMILYMRRGGEYPSYPILQCISLEQLDNAFATYNQEQ